LGAPEAVTRKKSLRTNWGGRAVLIGIVVAVIVLGVQRFSDKPGPIEDAGPRAVADGREPVVLRIAEGPEATKPTLDTLRQEPDAGSLEPLKPVASWREKWAGIPLDQSGQSLGAEREAFRAALVAAFKPVLSKCKDMLPPDKIVAPFDVELFVEAVGNGYDVQRAEISPDAGFDNYERRCFEGAFEKHVSLGDSRNTGGVLHHLSFPITLSRSAPDPADAGS
jgi:hypothetical protein